MANEPSLPKIELELCEQDWPLCPDPVAELVEATAGCSVVVAYAMGGNLEATIPLDQPRLRDAFRRLHNRLLEVELRLLQLETTKRHSPGKQMLIADRINRALLRLGHGEDGVRSFWAEFYSEGGPSEPDAKRTAVSRAARKR